MDKNTILFCEKWFSMYYKLPNMILKRKTELSYKEIDENVGGGKCNIPAKAIENMVIKQMSDARLKQLESFLDACEYTMKQLDSMDEKVKELVVEKYFNNYGVESWEDVAERVGWSKSQAYKIRYRTMEFFANRLGLLDTL